MSQGLSDASKYPYNENRIDSREQDSEDVKVMSPRRRTYISPTLGTAPQATNPLELLQPG